LNKLNKFEFDNEGRFMQHSKTIRCSFATRWWIHSRH